MSVAERLFLIQADGITYMLCSAKGAHFYSWLHHRQNSPKYALKNLYVTPRLATQITAVRSQKSQETSISSVCDFSLKLKDVTELIIELTFEIIESNLC